MDRCTQGDVEIETEEHPQSEGHRVSVVLPSYNERENISEAVERISKSLGDQLHEIIVVDDNSPDETWKVVEGLNNPQVQLIRRMEEKGLASALADGVAAAKGNVVVWMDCDLGLPPEDIPRLVEKLDKYDVAIGSRYTEGGKDLRPKIRAAISTVLNWYSGMLLGFAVRDYTSGFVAVKKPVLDEVRWSRKGFGEYFIEFAHRSRKKGFKIVEVGYVFKDRTEGKSKSSGIRTMLKYGSQYGMKVFMLRMENFINKQKRKPRNG